MDSLWIETEGVGERERVERPPVSFSFMLGVKDVASVEVVSSAWDWGVFSSIMRGLVRILRAPGKRKGRREREDRDLIYSLNFQATRETDYQQFRGRVQLRVSGHVQGYE